MHSYLKLVSQSPFVALSVSDIKYQLNVSQSDTSQDILIAAYLAAAVKYCERTTNLDLRQTTWTLVADLFPFPPGYTWQGVGYYPFFIPNAPYYALGREIQRCQAINLKRGPLSSLNSIQYYDTTNVLQTLDVSTYVYTTPSYFPGTIEPLSYYPVAYPRPDAVQVSFTNNMAVVPDEILHAIRLLCAEAWNNREGIAYSPSTVSGATGKAVCSLLDFYTVYTAH